MAADVGLEGFDTRSMFASFLLDLRRRVFRLVVVEHHVRARLREELDGRGPNAARTPGDECGLACQ
jgi:hypothetical protein